jgi:DNA-directed RNA polymerase subunit RPC12/RpoP
MPFVKEITYKCKKCGYKFSKSQGDVIRDEDLMPQCPKCGSRDLKILCSKLPFEKENIFLKIIRKIKGC